MIKEKDSNVMTESDYKRQLYKIEKMEKSWVREKEIINRKNALKNEKDSILQSNKKKISTTKIIVAFIFLNCTIVELYSMWVMYKLMDLSALYTLITAVVGETLAFAIYAVKSTKENTVGGIVYEQMKNSTEGVG